MSAGDLDRLTAAMKAARAQITGRTMEQVDADIHRERLAILADEPPELQETLDEYVARIVGVHGTTYTDAAAEHYQGDGQREARAAEEARKFLARLVTMPDGGERAT